MQKYYDEQGHIDHALADLDIAGFRRAEQGDPLVAAPVTALAHRGVQKLAADLTSPSRASQGRLAAAEAAAPDMLSRARQVAAVRSMTKPQLLFVDPKNAKEITNSIGRDKVMANQDVAALLSTVGTNPKFEPQIFTMNVAGPTTFDLFPAFALASPAGGPLPVGYLFNWCASHIRLTSSLLNTPPGIQFSVLIDFAGPAAPKNQMSMVYEWGAANNCVELSVVHGVLTGGDPALNNQLIQVSGGIPVPGLTFPRVRVEGLSTSDFQAAYRFMVAGDYPTERFTRRAA